MPDIFHLGKNLWRRYVLDDDFSVCFANITTAILNIFHVVEVEDPIINTEVLIDALQIENELIWDHSTFHS